jgi:hypothetical protein
LGTWGLRDLGTWGLRDLGTWTWGLRDLGRRLGDLENQRLGDLRARDCETKIFNISTFEDSSRVTCHSSLVTRYLSLVTCYALLVTCHSLLVTCHFPTPPSSS